MSYVVRGIDVAAWEPRIVWEKVRSKGIHFAIIKVTEGTGYFNPYFNEHWAGAKAVGIIRGAYHYLLAGQDGERQADIFLQKVKFEEGDLPPFLDLEEANNDGQPNSNFIRNAEAWLKKVEQATGRRPFVYSRASFLKTKLVDRNGNPPPWAKNYETWIAHYFYAGTEGHQPLEAPGWKPWVFWQHTDKATLDGVYDKDWNLTGVDLNWYRGTLDELYQLAGAKQPEPIEYKVETGDTLLSIADKHNLRLEQLLDANPKLIRKGMKLTIPVLAPVLSEEPVPSPGEAEGGTPDMPVSGAEGEYITHVVGPGDTLSGLALKYKVTVDEIVKLNNIPNPNLIIDGHILKIPKKKPRWNPFG